MACQEDCDQNIKPEFGTDMRSKHSRRKHKQKKNKRDSNAWQSLQPVPQPFGRSSQFNWFWENYYNALEWQERHQVAYWKSRSIALEYENNLLHQYVQSLFFNGGNNTRFPVSTQGPRISTPDRVRSSKGSSKRNMDQYTLQEMQFESNEECKESDTNQDEFEFQVTDEMMDFFEQSIRHKMELKKQREEEKKEAEKEKGFDNTTLPPRKQVGLQRIQEMKLMYGEAAPKILGMETAMQLSFDRNCDLRQPKLWPNIPLKL